MNVDVEKLRTSIIKFNGLRNVDRAYTFFHDETNNIRKFHLAEDGFNVSDPGNFVLAGVVHRGSQSSANLDALVKSIGLQKTAKELKFKHVASGDFEAVIGSEKLGALLQWILDGDHYIHYLNLNIIYWALVDIVDSVLPETSPELVPIHMQLKGDLYRVVMNDRLGFVCNGQDKPDTFSGSLPIKSSLKLQRRLVA